MLTPRNIILIKKNSLCSNADYSAYLLRYFNMSSTFRYLNFNPFNQKKNSSSLMNFCINLSSKVVIGVSST